jgi:hypothetical protein
MVIGFVYEAVSLLNHDPFLPYVNTKLNQSEKGKQKSFVTLYDHVHCCTCIFGILDLMIHDLKKENNMSLPRFYDKN